MVKNFRQRIMIIFLVVLSGLAAVVFTIDYDRMQRSLEENNEKQVELVKSNVLQSLRYVDRAYYMFDEDIATEMREVSNELVDKYTENPDFESWDYEELKEKHGMDIFIVNSDFVVTHSSFPDDVGLDFKDCCEELMPFLKDRIKGSEMAHDGFDVQQETGGVKKFSYMPTPDNEYMIELAYELEETELMNQFNFLDVANELAAKHSQVEDINIYNYDGWSIIGEEGAEGYRIDGEEKEHMIEARDSKSEVWLEKEDGGIRKLYVPYFADHERGISGNRIVEITYNNDELERLTRDNTIIFTLQFVMFMGVGVMLSYATSRLVARPMFLAFHDSLTGVKNRAYFDSLHLENKNDGKGSTGFMLMDLDNFKSVNDELGHDRGDTVLKHVSKFLKNNAGKDETVIRLGGDEFMIVKENVMDREELRVKAQEIMSGLNTPLKDKRIVKEKVEKGEDILSLMNVTISVGGAIFPEDAKDVDQLYKNADIALYEAKNAGKNQFRSFEDIKDEVEGDDDGES